MKFLKSCAFEPFVDLAVLTLMGLERVRIALLRGFDIPRGPMREDALDWVKQEEDRRERPLTTS